MDREIAKFYEELFRDANVKQKLENKMKEISSEEELRKLIEEEIVPAAQKMGKDFAVEDFVNFEKRSIKQLDVDDLENISGGVSLKSVILGGGLLAMSLLGVKINTADAAIPISNTTNYDLSPNEAVKTQGGASSQNEGADTQNENEAVKQEKNEKGTDESNSKKMPMKTAINSDLGNDQSKDDASKPAQYNTGEKYIWTALNPRYALIMNLSGATKNFRFYNGDIQNIAFMESGRTRLDFKKFKGEGSANLMTSLFPSSAGVFETGGGLDSMYPLSKCNPSPELMAEIVAWLHNHVRTTNKDEKIDLSGISVSNWNKLKTADIKKLEAAYKTLSDINAKLNNKEKINWKVVQNDDDIKNAANALSFKKIANEEIFKNFYAEFPNKYKIASTIQKSECLKELQKKDLETVLYVLKNAQCMIENQEQTNEQDKERTLPKYTTERMLMCYFLNHFNKESDLTKFYVAVRENIKGHTSVLDKTDELDELDGIKKHDESIKKFLSKFFEGLENSPYKNELEANKSAKKIIKNGEELQFIKDSFPDCADITVGHFMNLMGYNDKDKWDFFLSDANDTTLTDKEDILKAIEGNSVLPDLNLKQKLQAFISYISQRDIGADNSEVKTRSFWNAVVSNMDTPEANTGLYAIRYHNDTAGNEVDTGYVNMLKVTYNLLHALKSDSTEENKELLEKAKTAIDKLDAATKTNIKNELLQTAMESVVHIFDKHAEVNIHNTDEKNNDIYGKISICSNKKTFKISQSTGHAFIDFNPLKIEPLNADNDADILKLLKTDPVAQLLSHFFNIKYEKSAIPFNKYYAKNVSDIDDNSQHYANVSALKFLKAVQGEDENINRIYEEINKNCVKTDIMYQGEKNKKGKLGKFILENYVLKNYSIFDKLFGDNYNLKSDHLYQSAQKSNLIGRTDNGSEYLCIDNGNGVSILPFWGTEGCPEKFVIPSTVTIGDKSKQVSGLLAGAFYKNKKIKTVEFSDGFNSTTFDIGKRAFTECENLTSFSIPESVSNLNIGDKAFYYTGLHDFSFSENVSELNIGDSAFCSTHLKNFSIPKNVSDLNIRDMAFAHCDKLTNFYVPENVRNLHIGESAFEECSLKSFDVTGHIDKLNIEKGAFYYSSIENFAVSGAVKELNIGEYAFEECSLKSFDVTGHIDKLNIEKEAFKDSKIESLTFSDGVKELNIGEHVFEKSPLTSFTIKGEVENLNIAKEAFWKSEIQNFAVSGGVKELNIGESAFGHAPLTSFTIGGNVENLNIEKEAFKESTIQRFAVIGNVKELNIRMCAFSRSSLESFQIKGVDNLTISSYAFSDANLKSFEIPGNVSTLAIGESAFSNNRGLQSFKISDSVEKLTINRIAFCNCLELSEFTIPGNINMLTIGDDVFRNTQLENFKILGDIANLSISDLAFNGCKGLKLEITGNIQNGEVTSVFKKGKKIVPSVKLEDLDVKLKELVEKQQIPDTVK